MDEDRDGNADVIVSQGSPRHAFFISPDMIEKLEGNYDIGKNGLNGFGRKIPRMTPEIRKIATEIMNSQRNLEYLMDKERFDSKRN